jgi:starch synthase
LKKVYHEDPIFTESKVVLSIYNEGSDQVFNEDTRSKVIVPGIRNKDLETINPANGINLAKLAIQYANGIILGSEEIVPELKELISGSSLKVLPYIDVNDPESAYIKDYKNFYDQILGKNEKKD